MNLLVKILTFWIPVRVWRHKLRHCVERWLSDLIPLQDNWIVFYDTFSKSGNGDSIYPLASELRKHHPTMRFFFVSNVPRDIEMADEVLVLGSKRYDYIMKRAKYLISPMDVPNGKRHGQIWVMTWHGAPLKTIGLLRRNDTTMREYVKSFRNCNYFCNTSSVFADLFKKSFDLTDSMFVNTGLPRNDILLHTNRDVIAESVRKKLHIPKNKKVLFYCPTWRRTDWHQPMPFDMEKMKQELGKDYILLIRSHVGKHTWVDKNGHDINDSDINNEFFVNVADYNNLSELYLITDVFITDYSSAVFDFSLLERPQILFAYDLEQYITEIGLTMDYYKFSPFPIVKTQQELIDAIKNSSKQKPNDLHEFRQRYAEYDKGSASRQILSIIGLEE